MELIWVGIAELLRGGCAPKPPAMCSQLSRHVLPTVHNVLLCPGLPGVGPGSEHRQGFTPCCPRKVSRQSWEVAALTELVLIHLQLPQTQPLAAKAEQAFVNLGRNLPLLDKGIFSSFIVLQRITQQAEFFLF